MIDEPGYSLKKKFSEKDFNRLRELFKQMGERYEKQQARQPIPQPVVDYDDLIDDSADCIGWDEEYGIYNIICFRPKSDAQSVESANTAIQLTTDTGTQWLVPFANWELETPDIEPLVDNHAGDVFLRCPQDISRAQLYYKNRDCSIQPTDHQQIFAVTGLNGTDLTNALENKDNVFIEMLPSLWRYLEKAGLRLPELSTAD